MKTPVTTPTGAGQLVGYARTSTTDQKAGLEAQLRDLTGAGCAKVFREELSSVAATRPELERTLDYVREGDTLIVTKLDRLARSVADLVEITARLRAKGVALRILAMNLDTGTPTGKLMLNLLGSIAEFERELMLERQREGIAKAKAEGKYKGRAPTAKRKAAEVIRLKAEGKTGDAIAQELGIGRASVFRILRAQTGTAAD
ncbi:recombinase family protein [Mesorhizobium sp. M3A.F.Ca.ET.080.04.2.1]|uniref:recombinase family protein n=1 Tax=Mesorhizobium sp. M3A.F.Ca.ET.080.04.2.1 TaxID=2493676 RepID=UPI000F751A6C|nr:recombinase family protein [Mesorhizobium sp. M3A.F.Ca.ET.080.04.2.1]AZO09716.1 recombinase family protein [Mesorhizobium sp. M3A.F.Ca.ET.080.04.2.1]RWF24305.1 MAG: recombinase family protein [Mesorhizobium sp.]TGT57720.1 recombinase family protein [Mesorhizobium sp. M00.F.Ca.ET.170.01.1.1]